MKTTAELIYQFSPLYKATTYFALSPGEAAKIKRALMVLQALEEPSQRLGSLINKAHANVSWGSQRDSRAEIEEATAKVVSSVILGYVDEKTR